MPRPQSPETRRTLIERSAALLAARRPVTLNALVEGTGVSTMAVYTYFGGMPGLWGAVRQEGFVRLADRLAAVEPSRDPVRHLGALGVAYAEHALANPDLYRVMFDSVADLPDPAVATSGFEPLVGAVTAAKAARRIAADADPADVAVRYWASGHGLASLVVTGVLAPADLRRHAPELAVAVLVAAGDDPARAASSVRLAWKTSTIR